MIEYLLDTNICIAIMTNQAHVRRHIQSVDVDSVAIPSLVLFELLYGVKKSVQQDRSQRRYNDFCAQFPRSIAWSEQDAAVAAHVRATLEAEKQPIGHYDTLIAGQAIARGLTLVTANEREFRRVKGLRWENWAKA